MELFFIRHGETDYNLNNKYCGSSDISINETGRNQARSLRNRIGEFSADIFFSSPYKRAQETAQLVFPGHDLVLEPALREVNFGQWEGMDFRQIQEKYGDLYLQWLADPSAYTPPEGEPLNDVVIRVRNFLSICQNEFKNKRVVCVCHGGIVKIVVCLLLEKDLSSFWEIPATHASVTYFKFKADALDEYKGFFLK